MQKPGRVFNSDRLLQVMKIKQAIYKIFENQCLIIRIPVHDP